MFALSESLHYYLYNQPTDMRKSFDSLCQLVETVTGRNPLSGEVYVFINRPRNRMKLLRWEFGGFILDSNKQQAKSTPKPRVAKKPPA